MYLIVPSLLASLVLVLLIYAVAKGRFGVAGVCCLTAAAAAVSLFLGVPAFLLHALGSLLLALFCAARRRGPRAMLATSVIAMVASYGLILSREFYTLHQRLSRNSGESLVDRLAYEEQRTASISAPPVLAAEIEQRLHDFENHRRHSIRSLASLHEEIRDDFFDAPGNGRSRVPRNLKYLRFELPPVRLPAAPEYEDSSSEPPAELAMRPSVESASPAHSRLLALHDAGLEDFLNHNRMGYFQDRKHVALFWPHRFLSVPKIDDLEANPWQLVKLELVSLLKHDVPVAYIAEQLPQMDKLKDAPTRRLNPFERASLARLQSDEDLVTEESPNRIRMLGSLRAAKSCLGCHSVQRGELLGAFSYELIPHRRQPASKGNLRQPDEA